MGTDVIGGLLIVPVVAETLMGFLMSTLGSGPNGLSNSFPWSPFQSGSIILAIPVHILNRRRFQMDDFIVRLETSSVITLRIKMEGVPF